MEEEKYVIIAENKLEGPLVWETPLKNASYIEVRERMIEMKNSPDIIRVCMAKLVYETGNETLLPQNKE